MIRHIGIAALIGIICVGLLWLINKHVWANSPYPDSPSNEIRMATWGFNTLKVKAAGMGLIFISSVGVSIYHRKDWRVALICAVTTALVFQCALVAIYIMRHGHESYLKYHNELDTVLLTLAIPYSVSILVSLRSFLKWNKQRKSKMKNEPNEAT